MPDISVMSRAPRRRIELALALAAALTAVLLPARAGGLDVVGQTLTVGDWTEHWAPEYVGAFGSSGYFSYEADLTGTFTVGGRMFVGEARIGDWSDNVMDGWYDIDQDRTYIFPSPIYESTRRHTNPITGSCWGTFAGKPVDRPSRFEWWTCEARVGDGPLGVRALVVRVGGWEGCDGCSASIGSASGHYRGTPATG